MPEQKLKILLAIGFIDMEKIIKDALQQEFSFVGVATDKEGIISMIQQKNPDILVLRETLRGQANVFHLLNQIRYAFPKIRIIFLGKKREVGNDALSVLVSYGIYDIISSDTININDIIRLIKKPKEFKDVMNYLNPVNVSDDFGNLTEINPIKATFSVKNEEESKEKEDLEDKRGNAKEEKKKEDTKKETPKKETKEATKVIVKEKIIKKEVIKERIIEKNVLVKPNIIVFTGGREGVGSSTLALNTATYLATKKNKTLLIELDHKQSYMRYLFSIYSNSGIETAMEALISKDYKNIESSIHNINKEIDDEFKKIIPNELNVMIFDDLMNEKSVERISENMTELIITLIHKCKFQNIIIDCPSFVNRDLKQEIYSISDMIFITATQNIIDLTYAKKEFDSLVKKNELLKDRCHFLINKFSKTSISKEVLKELLEHHFYTFDGFHKEIIETDFQGIPLVSRERKAFNQDFFKTLDEKLKKK
jgi:cellulose biosynthesis protein BcsQ